MKRSWRSSTTTVFEKPSLSRQSKNRNKLGVTIQRLTRTHMKELGFRWNNNWGLGKKHGDPKLFLIEKLKMWYL